MPRSETLRTDQFSGSGGDPDFTVYQIRLRVLLGLLN
jgi:hypothetical protein